MIPGQLPGIRLEDDLNQFCNRLRALWLLFLSFSAPQGEIWRANPPDYVLTTVFGNELLSQVIGYGLVVAELHGVRRTALRSGTKVV